MPFNCRFFFRRYLGVTCHVSTNKNVAVFISWRVCLVLEWTEDRLNGQLMAYRGAAILTGVFFFAMAETDLTHSKLDRSRIYQGHPLRALESRAFLTIRCHGVRLRFFKHTRSTISARCRYLCYVYMLCVLVATPKSPDFLFLGLHTTQSIPLFSFFT